MTCTDIDNEAFSHKQICNMEGTVGSVELAGDIVTNQPEGSHVHWPITVIGTSEGDEFTAALHRMKGDAKNRSSSWSVRFPNDEFVLDEGVTLEQMRGAGAV